MAELVAYVPAVMALEPGDVILTGTLARVAPRLPRDRLAADIDEIGFLENVVVVHSGAP